MNKSLVGIERDLIFAYISNDKIPLLVRPLGVKGEYLSAMTLVSSQYKLLPQGILFFKAILPQWQIEEKHLIQVSFFYKGRGLYFISPLRRLKNGYALVLPKTVQKMTDTDFDKSVKISAKIYCSGFSSAHAHCKSETAYPLFEYRSWLYYSKEEAAASEMILKQIANLEPVKLSDRLAGLIERSKRILYIPDKKLPARNFFPFPATITDEDVIFTERTLIAQDLAQTRYGAYIPLAEHPDADIHSFLGLKTKLALISPLDISDTLLLLPLCRFLTDKSKRLSPVQGRAVPLHILCITDSAFILGAHQANWETADPALSFPLQQETEYLLDIFVPLSHMCRNIKVNMHVAKIYTHAGSICALCKFINLKEEDKRFLYEKYYRTLCL